MKDNQCEKILAYMREHGGITQRGAIQLGCYRLSARIHDIKKRGKKVVTTPIRVMNADGSYSTVAFYKLEDET